MVNTPVAELREFNLSFLPARLFVCLSQAEYDRVVTEVHGEDSNEKWLDPTSQDGCTQICDSAKAETRLIVVCIDPAVCPDLKRLVEVAAHEACHVVQMIERVMSEKEPGMEYPAYLLGKVTQFIFNQCTHKYSITVKE